jgi:hypothetical protein
MCLDSKVSWVEVPEGGDRFKRYPEKGIEEWHKDEGCFYGGEEPAAEVKEQNKKRKTK